MKLTVDEIMQEIKRMCNDAGYKFLVEIDDGTSVFGMYEVITNSNLHYMARACSGIAGKSTEETH